MTFKIITNFTQKFWIYFILILKQIIDMIKYTIIMLTIIIDILKIIGQLE